MQAAGTHLAKLDFTAGLAGKEHSNPQFMFLKPTHSMFGFFTSLCDAYSRVLMPDKGLMQKLHQDASDRSAHHTLNDLPKSCVFCANPTFLSLHGPTAK